MLHGHFLEATSDSHVHRREHLLGRPHELAQPRLPVILGQAEGFLDETLGPISSALTTSGLALVQLDRPLDNPTFLELGRYLGQTMYETDPAVAEFVEEGVILNLISKHGKTSDVSLQPFSTNYLSLHSESSGRPTATQPRYIVLMCVAPGDSQVGARTVIVPMKSVESRLPARTIEILKSTRYRHSDGDPMICRETDGRAIFSFRDFQEQRLEWTSTRQDASEEEINEAIRQLLASKYHSEGASAVDWKRGLLVIIDNTFFFHGRTCRAAIIPTEQRHLKRLRVMV